MWSARAFENGERRFALTPLGEALKTGGLGSARATLIALAGQWSWRTWEEIMYSLETGKSGFEKVFGMPVFDYLAQHPEEASDQGAPGFGLRFVNWINPRRRLPSIRSWIPRPVRISWTAAKQPTMHLRGNGSYAAIRRRLPLLPNTLVSELKVDFNGGRGALPDNLADTCIRCRCHLPAHKHEWKKDRTMNAQQLDLRVRNLDCEHLPPRYPDRSV